MHSAPRCEAAGYLHRSRRQCRDQVVQDAVDHVFVEYALVAKALEVGLQALQLDTKGVGNVLDLDRAEVRLPGLGA